MDTLVTHPLFDYRVSYRRLLEIQARLLAKTLHGELGKYPVFVTRVEHGIGRRTPKILWCRWNFNTSLTTPTASLRYQQQSWRHFNIREQIGD